MTDNSTSRPPPTERAAAVPTPMETLDAAADHIAAGRVQEGARLAYDAAFRAVADAARRHNRHCKTVADAREFVRWLDGLPTEPGDWPRNTAIFDWVTDDQAPQLPIPEFVGAFNVAEEFKRHGESPAELTHWQPDEYVIFLPAVRELIEKVETAQPRAPSIWMR